MRGALRVRMHRNLDTETILTSQVEVVAPNGDVLNIRLDGDTYRLEEKSREEEDSCGR